VAHSIPGGMVATIYKHNSTYWVRFQWHGTATVLPVSDAI
jgi:hypothetical protein